MVESSQDIDLSMDRHELALSRQELLLIGFERYLVPRLYMSRLLDDGKSTLANHLIDLKVRLEVENRVLFLSFEYFYQLNELVSRLVLVWYLLHHL